MATPESAPRRVPSGRVVVAAAVALTLVSGVVGGLIVHFSSDDSSSSSGTDSASCQATKVANSVLPSIVTLSVRNGSASGSGSGETIRSDGYILTNDHVISAAVGGGTVDVLFSNGKTERATLVGRSSRLDLAVVKVDAPDKLPTIAFGTSQSLRVGQAVVALGAPLGLDGTVTSGIVSAIGRDVPVPAPADSRAFIPGAVQTDAAINPGNSGGALVDCAGHLVGINTAIATVPNSTGVAGGGSVGIGFAIPIDLASVVADDLIANGKFTAPYLGLTTIPIPPAVAGRFNITDGLFVQAVSAGGPAAQAGLEEGDIILRADGKNTPGPDGLFTITLTKRAGDKIDIEYVRDGKSLKTTLTVGDQP